MSQHVYFADFFINKKRFNPEKPMLLHEISRV